MSKYNIPKIKGYYVLFIEVSSDCRVTTRGGKVFDIKPGIYAYLGSAFGRGGLFSRISRHLKKEKNLFWHIDYLLDCKHARILSYLIIPCSEKVKIDYESSLSQYLSKIIKPVKGFGSSDKHRDVSHLFYCGDSIHKCTAIIEEALSKINSSNNS